MRRFRFLHANFLVCFQAHSRRVFVLVFYFFYFTTFRTYIHLFIYKFRTIIWHSNTAAHFSMHYLCICVCTCVLNFRIFFLFIFFFIFFVCRQLCSFTFPQLYVCIDFFKNTFKLFLGA